MVTAACAFPLLFVTLCLGGFILGRGGGGANHTRKDHTAGFGIRSTHGAFLPPSHLTSGRDLVAPCLSFPHHSFSQQVHEEPLFQARPLEATGMAQAPPPPAPRLRQEGCVSLGPPVEKAVSPPANSPPPPPPVRLL